MALASSRMHAGSDLDIYFTAGSPVLCCRLGGVAGLAQAISDMYEVRTVGLSIAASSDHFLGVSPPAIDLWKSFM